MRQQIQIADDSNLRTSPDKSDDSNILAQTGWSEVVDADQEGEWFKIDTYVHESVCTVIKRPQPDTLGVPYRSQWDTDADNRTADCGQTCCAMLAEWMGVAVDVNDLRFQQSSSGMSNATDLVNNLQSVGLPAKRVLLTPTDLLPQPGSICLVNYGGFDRSSVQDAGYYGWHWLIFLHADDDGVTVHDPDWWGSRREEGAGKQYRIEEWQRAFIPYPGATQLDTVRLNR
jgi:hypothetical protein